MQLPLPPPPFCRARFYLASDGVGAPRSAVRRLVEMAGNGVEDMATPDVFVRAGLTEEVEAGAVLDVLVALASVGVPFL